MCQALFWPLEIQKRINHSFLVFFELMSSEKVVEWTINIYMDYIQSDSIKCYVEKLSSVSEEDERKLYQIEWSENLQKRIWQKRRKLM